MKSNSIKPVRSAIFSKLLLYIFLTTVSYFGALYIFDNVFNGILRELLYGHLSYPVYQVLTNNQTQLLAAVYIVIICVIVYRTISKSIGYIDIISSSLDSLLIKEMDIRTFPAELKDVEITLREIKQVTFEKERLAREAEQRKNDLVVYLAHDLKTPLTSIIGYLSLMKEAPQLPEAQRAKYTDITLDKAYRLEDLINEFFDITRFNLQSISLENNHIDLSMMLHQMVDEFYPILSERHLSASLQIQPDLKLIGDADKLARVFDNLLKNAVSYSYENTRIQIVARRMENNVVITFINQGDEIPKEQIERIFEKFFRADKARHSATGGAGLGLAIAKQIIELHGGSIQALSTKEGTRFIVTLPTREEG